MTNFFKDTKDTIEKLFGKEVLEGYPNYAIFWENYIGQKNEAKTLDWYDYQFPKTWDDNQITGFRSKLTELFMSHYTIFVNFAGAHHIAKQLNSLGLVQEDFTYFEYWHYFDCMYFYLGNAGYQTNRFFNILKKFPKSGIGRDFKYLKDFLFANHEAIGTLYTDIFGAEKGTVGMIRNNLVHVQKLYAMSVPSHGYAIPINIPFNAANLDIIEEYEKGETVLAHFRANADLERAEKSINQIENLFIQLFGQIIERNNVIICKN